jgi:CHASE3 domain sensor protein
MFTSRILVAFVATASLTFVACGSSDTGHNHTQQSVEAAQTEQTTAAATQQTTTTQVEQPASVAEQLATLEENAPVSADDPLVRKFDRQLDGLQRKCSDTRSRLSDDTVRARELLSKAGIDEQLDSIITHVNASIPHSTDKQPCVSIFAAYVTLRRGG